MTGYASTGKSPNMLDIKVKARSYKLDPIRFESYRNESTIQFRRTDDPVNVNVLFNIDFWITEELKSEIELFLEKQLQNVSSKTNMYYIESGIYRLLDKAKANLWLSDNKTNKHKYMIRGEPYFNNYD